MGIYDGNMLLEATFGYKVIIFENVIVGESPDCLLLSGTVVGENPDYVCWALEAYFLQLIMVIFATMLSGYIP